MIFVSTRRVRKITSTIFVLFYGVLEKHKLDVKFSKCEFRLNFVKFLGHVVLKEGVMVDPQKIEVV